MSIHAVSSPTPSPETSRRFNWGWLFYGLPLMALGGACLFLEKSAPETPWVFPIVGWLLIASGLLAWFGHPACKGFALLWWAVVAFALFPIGSIYALLPIGIIVRSFIRKNQSPRREEAGAPITHIRILVERAAKEALDINESKFERSIDELRIPLIDYHYFLEDLEREHGLLVPRQAWKGSTSILGVIAVLEEQAYRKASERLY